MSSLNKVQLIGNLGNDPDIINEGKIAKFSLATSESWKDKASGERKTKTEWHNIVVFNEGLVGVIQQYVKKGSKVYVEGQLQTRKWEETPMSKEQYNELMDAMHLSTAELEAEYEIVNAMIAHNLGETKLSKESMD